MSNKQGAVYGFRLTVKKRSNRVVGGKGFNCSITYCELTTGNRKRLQKALKKEKNY